MNFLLNRGDIFSKPGESHLALLRQFLIANYGVPWSVLYAELVEQTCKLNNTQRQLIESIYCFYNIPKASGIIFQTDGPLKSCPKCQHQLYHSTLFDLPSLDKCPLHRCDLTLDCPQCGEKWPSLQDLPHRKCRMCGIFPLTELNDYWPHYSVDKRYKSFDGLRALLYSHRPFTNIFNSPTTSPSSYRYSSTIRSSPNYIAYYKRHAYLSGDKLTHLELCKRNIGKRQTFVNESIVTPDIKIQGRNDIHPLYFELLKTRFKAIKQIVKLIDTATKKRHEIVLGIPNIRYDITSLSSCCPICLTITMWILSNIGYPYPYRPRVTFDSFGSLKFLLPYSQFEPCAITHVEDKDGANYRLNQDLILWMYQRDLEYSFVELFEIIVRLIKISRENQFPYKEFTFQDGAIKWLDHLRESYSDQCVSCFDGRVYIHYSLQSPLDLLNLEEVRGVSNLRHKKTDDFEMSMPYLLSSTDDLISTVSSLEKYAEFERNIVLQGRQEYSYEASSFRMWKAEQCSCLENYKGADLNG